MHIRFRRTFKVLPGVKLNISRHGISTSVGPRGAHLTFNRFGVRQSVGLPGTGLSEVGYLVKDKKSGGAAGLLGAAGAAGAAGTPADAHHSIHHGEGMGCELEGCGCLIVLIVIAAIAVFIGANNLHLLPANTLSHSLQLLTTWLHKVGF